MRQPCLSMAITSNTMPQVCQHQLVVYRYSAFSPHILSSTHDSSHLRTNTSHTPHFPHTPHSHTSLTHFALARLIHPPSPISPGGGRCPAHPCCEDQYRTCPHGTVHVATEQTAGHTSAPPHEAGEDHLVSHWQGTCACA